MKKLSLLAFCAAVALSNPVFTGTVSPVLAADTGNDHLNKGYNLYRAGQYCKALGYLQSAVSKKPKVWQAHYYLANTYLALGQRDEAYGEYRLCQAYRPSPEVAKACEQIVSKLAAAARPTEGMPQGDDTAHKQYIIQQKQAILNDAGRQAQLMRDRTNEAISSGNLTGNPFSSNTDVPDEARNAERARKMQYETEAKAVGIYEAARRRANQIK